MSGKLLKLMISALMTVNLFSINAHAENSDEGNAQGDDILYVEEVNDDSAIQSVPELSLVMENGDFVIYADAEYLDQIESVFLYNENLGYAVGNFFGSWRVLTEENKLIITNEEMKKQGCFSGAYDIVINSDGYEQFQTFDASIQLSVEQDFPVTVSVDENNTIVIESDNLEILKKIAAKNETVSDENGNSILPGAMFEFLGNNSIVRFENRETYDNGNIVFSGLELDEENNRILITSDVQKILGFMNQRYYSVIFTLRGEYLGTAHSEFDLVNALKTDAPAIQVSLMDNKYFIFTDDYGYLLEANDITFVCREANEEFTVSADKLIGLDSYRKIISVHMIRDDANDFGNYEIEAIITSDIYTDNNITVARGNTDNNELAGSIYQNTEGTICLTDVPEDSRENIVVKFINCESGEAVCFFAPSQIVNNGQNCLISLSKIYAGGIGPGEYAVSVRSDSKWQEELYFTEITQGCQTADVLIKKHNDGTLEFMSSDQEYLSGLLVDIYDDDRNVNYNFISFDHPENLTENSFLIPSELLEEIPSSCKNIAVSSYGYTNVVQTVNLGAEPDPYSAYIDSNKNLVIEFSDPDHCAAVKRVSMNNSVGTKYYTLYDSGYTYYSQKNYQSIVLSYDGLIAMGITPASYVINIIADGYDTCSFDFELTEGAKILPEITISQDENGNLVFESDAEFLEVVNFDLYKNLNDCITIKKGCSYVSLSENKMTVSADHLLSCGYQDGTYRVNVSAYGYGTEIIFTEISNLDRTAPAMIDRLAVNSRTARTIDIGWSKTSDISGINFYSVYLNGELYKELQDAELQACETSEGYCLTIDGLTPEQAYSIAVSATDGKGNQSEVKRIDTETVIPDFTVDNLQEKYILESALFVDLQMELISQSNRAAVNSSILLQKAGEEAVELADSADNECSARLYFSELDEGDYTILFSAEDASGYVVKKTKLVRFEHDQEAPEIVFDGPSNTTVYQGHIGISVIAQDNANLRSFSVLVSKDGIDWDELDAMSNDGSIVKKYDINESWDISDIKVDGTVGGYVKAVASDSAGNTNESDIIAVLMDNVAPADVSSVSSFSDETHIELTWEKSIIEKDLANINIYRSTDNEQFVLIKKLNKTDKSFSESLTDGLDNKTTYYYRINAVDNYGNESIGSAVLTCKLVEDVLAPTINSILPADNSRLMKECTFSVSVSDNYSLKSLHAEYRKEGEDTWIELFMKSVLTQKKGEVFTYEWDVSSLESGAYEIRFTAEDNSGFQKEETNTYNIQEYRTPEAILLRAEPKHKGIEFNWSVEGETSLIKEYSLYRSVGGNWTKLKTTTESTCTVNYLTPYEDGQYLVELIDKYGYVLRSETITAQAIIDDQTAPVAVLSPLNASVTEGESLKFISSGSYDNDRIVSYEWVVNDQTVSAEAALTYTFSTSGEYSVTLKITDEAGNTGTQTTAVKVLRKLEAVRTSIRVIDVATDVEAVNIIYKIQKRDGSDEGITGTAENGIIKAALLPGSYLLNVMGDGYLSNTMSFTILEEDGDKELSIQVAQESFLIGNVTVTEMTIEEILAAGIDINDPDNQHVYRQETEFQYQITTSEGMVVMQEKLVTFLNALGDALANIITQGGGGSGGSGGGNGGNGGSGGNGDNDHDNGDEMIWPAIYHPSKEYYLIIRGETHWLKEMFDVELLLTNGSNYTLSDLSATLKLPDGLSLAKMVYGSQSTSVTIGELLPGEKNSTHWYIKGDEAGSYSVGVDVTGVNQNGTFNSTFTAKDSVNVLAGGAMHLTISAFSRAYPGEKYHVNYLLENVSDKPIYNLEIMIKNSYQYRITYLIEDERKEILGSDSKLASESIAVLEPGKSVEIDYYAKLDFDEIKDIEYYRLQEFVNVVSAGSTTEIPTTFNITDGILSEENLTMLALAKFGYVNCDAYVMKEATAALNNSSIKDAVIWNYPLVDSTEVPNSETYTFGDFMSPRLEGWKICKVYQRNGCYAVGLYNEQLNKSVITYRGSESFTGAGTNDWYEDIIFATCNVVTSQFYSALDFYEDFNHYCEANGYPKPATTGHSLGGGLAEIAAARYDAYGVSFDPAPMLDVAYYHMPEVYSEFFSGTENWKFYEISCENDKLVACFENEYKYRPSFLLLDQSASYTTGTIIDFFSEALPNEAKTHALGALLCLGEDGNYAFSQLIESVNQSAISSRYTNGKSLSSTTMASALNTLKSVLKKAGFSTRVFELIEVYQALTEQSLILGDEESNILKDTNVDYYSEIQGSRYFKIADSTFYSGAGNDLAYGFAGNDNFGSGYGLNYYDGGLGNDSYYHWKGSRTDTIYDVQGKNKLYLMGLAENDEVYLSEEQDAVKVFVNGELEVEFPKENRVFDLSEFEIYFNGKELPELPFLVNGTYVIGAGKLVFSALNNTLHWIGVFCPTEIEILDENENVVLVLPDNEEYVINNEFGNFYSFIEENGEYGKCFELAEPYTYRITATNDGVMTVAKMENLDDEKPVQIENIPIQTGEVYIPGADGSLDKYVDGELVDSYFFDGTVMIELDRDDCMLKAGETTKLNLSLSPENISYHFESDNEEIAVVDIEGNVTAVSKGTTIIRAIVNDGTDRYAAECRVDVVDEAPEDIILGFEIKTKTITASISKDIAAIVDFNIDLPQKINLMSVEEEEAVQTINSLVIKNVTMTEPLLSENFDIEITDDNTLNLISKLDCNGRVITPAKASYKTKFEFTVGDTTYRTEEVTVKIDRALPKITAAAVKMNRFFPEDTVIPVFTCKNGLVKGFVIDESKVNPDWITEEYGYLKLNEAGAKQTKNTSGKLNVLVEVEGYRGKYPVVLNVSTVNTVPGLKLSSAVVTVYNRKADSSGIKVSLVPTAKNTALSDCRIKTVSTESENWNVIRYDSESGTVELMLKEGREAVKETVMLDVGFEGTERIQSYKLTVKTVNTLVFKTDTKAVTLNRTCSDKAGAEVTVTPADYTGELELYVYDETAKRYRRQEDSDVVEAILDGRRLTFMVKDHETLTKSVKYRIAALGTDVNIKGAKYAEITVNITSATPGIALKTQGALDTVKPDLTVVVTPKYTNINDSNLINKSYKVYTKTKDGSVEEHTEDFDITESDGKIVIKMNHDSWQAGTFEKGQQYFVIETVTSSDRQFASKEVSFKVNQGKVAIGQSTKTVTLFKNDSYDEARIELDPSKTGLKINQIRLNNDYFDIRKVKENVYAIGFKNDVIDNRAKNGSVKLEVYLEGNNPAKGKPSTVINVTVKLETLSSGAKLKTNVDLVTVHNLTIADQATMEISMDPERFILDGKVDVEWTDLKGKSVSEPNGVETDLLYDELNNRYIVIINAEAGKTINHKLKINLMENNAILLTKSVTVKSGK